jgi:hypothetical protein
MGAAMSVETLGDLRPLVDRAARNRECGICGKGMSYRLRGAFCSSDCKNAYRRRRRVAQKRAGAARQVGTRA